MTPKQLEQLAISLTHEGYSRGYIRRLVQEIQDHRSCICQEITNQPIEESRNTLSTIERMGTNDEILAAVKVHNELMPFSKRYPLVTFAALPAFLLLLTTAIAVCLSNWIVYSISTGSGGFFRPLLVPVETAHFVFPILVAGVAGLVATRCRVPILFPMTTALVTAGAALFQVDFGYCVVSGSIICRQHWELNPLQLAGIWSALFAGLVASGLLVRRSNRQLILAD